MSNLALTVVMVPIVGQIALAWGVNPMLLRYSRDHREQLCIHASHGHAPNAIIFGSQRIAMKETGFGGFGVECDRGRARMGLGCVGFAGVVGVPSNFVV